MKLNQQTYQFFYNEKSEKQLNTEKKLYLVVYIIFAAGFIGQIAVSLGMIK